MVFEATDEYIFTVFIHNSRSICSVISQLQVNMTTRVHLPPGPEMISTALTQRRSEWNVHDSDKREASKYHFSGWMLIISSFTLLSGTDLPWKYL